MEDSCLQKEYRRVTECKSPVDKDRTGQLVVEAVVCPHRDDFHLPQRPFRRSAAKIMVLDFSNDGAQRLREGLPPEPFFIMRKAKTFSMHHRGRASSRSEGEASPARRRRSRGDMNALRVLIDLYLVQHCRAAVADEISFHLEIICSE
jgi:hypothetical protein